MSKLFAEKRSVDFFEERIQDMKSRVNNLSESDVLSPNLDLVVSRIKQATGLRPLEINWNGKEKSVEMRERHISTFPPTMYFARESDYVDVAVVKYDVPFTGSEELFWVRPNTYYQWTEDASTNQGKLQYCILTIYANVNLSDTVIEEVNRQNSRIVENTNAYISNINGEVISFNEGLDSRIKTLLAERKNTIEQRDVIKSKLK